MYLTKRRSALVKTIGVMTILPRAFLEKEFGPQVYHDLKWLMTFDIVKSISYSGRLKLYQLTSKGCSMAGKPEARSRSLGAQAIHHRVVVGFLTTIAGYSLIEREQAAEVLGPDAPPSVSFVMGTGPHGSIVFMVLTPGPHASVVSVVRAIHEKEKKRDRSKFAAGEFGYLVAVDSMPRKTALVRAFKRAGFYGKFQLRVEIGPSVNAQEMIRNASSAKTTN